MSFWKFWSKKDKSGEDGSNRSSTPPIDPETEKRRIKHSLSISRSGRYKQRNRERGQILDKPELFNDQAPGDGKKVNEFNQAQDSSKGSYVTPPANNSSPRNHCRDMNRSVTTRNNVRIGQSVVT